jgi:hypothetical protein
MQIPENITKKKLLKLTRRDTKPEPLIKSHKEMIKFASHTYYFRAKVWLI